MNRILLGFVTLSASLLASASLMGCLCTSSRVVTEEFEDFCDGAPCNWDVEGGTVTQVPTYHPDVRGVAIPAGVTITAREAFGTRLSLVLTRCDEGATLQVNGSAIPARSELYEWWSSSLPGNTTITVGGTGQCVIDDVGFYSECEL